MTGDDAQKGPLYDRHIAAGAKMAAEDGWQIPLSYGSALDEAAAARSGAIIADLSHAGRVRIRGDGAAELLARACTANAVRQEDDTAVRTLLLNERGGIIDECLLLRLEDFWVLLTSPPARTTVLAHLATLAADFDAKVDDQTDKTAQLAVAGPAAEKALAAVLPFSVSDMAAGAVKAGSLLLARYIAARTDRLGVWTLEVILPTMFAGQAWRFMTEKAGSSAIRPCGAAALDVLRVEAGAVRHGHEINETIDPFTAGLDALVRFDHDFIGRPELEKLRGRTPARRRVGLVLDAQAAANAIPRQGAAVFAADGREVGTVTSATFSPARGCIVAMAVVAGDCAADGTALSVDTPAGRTAARVAPLPFA